MSIDPIKPMQAGFRVLTPEEIKARDRRNLAVAGALIVMVVIFFIVTLVHLSGNVAQRAF